MGQVDLTVRTSQDGTGMSKNKKHATPEIVLASKGKMENKKKFRKVEM